MFKERRLGAAVRSCCCLISRPSRIRRSFRSGIRIVSTSDHVNQVLELLRKLMEYRSSDVRHRLEKVGRAASMLHMDVLLLIYHFARAAWEISWRLGLMLEDQQSPRRLARVNLARGK